MPELKKETFICLDCEMTGLDLEKDRIIEIAAIRFTFSSILDRYETLIDPECPISAEALAIHHISPEMVQGKPKMEEVLETILAFIGPHTVVGHGITHDLNLLALAAERAKIPCQLRSHPFIDTLRLARLYGDSPNNSLEQLALHFNVPFAGAHRAMNDVEANIEVFKHLTRRYQTTEQVFKVLSHPIKMKYMPLGKHKGRPFDEIPLQYLKYAAQMDFDDDLLFSIRSELKRRKLGGGFQEAANPFSNL